jgi:hypothetical protein
MATDPVKQLSEQLLTRIARLEFFISNLISSLSISRYRSYQAEHDIRKKRVSSWFRRKAKVKDEWENVLSHFDIELDNWREILNQSPNDELILGLASDLAGIKNDIYDLRRSISSIRESTTEWLALQSLGINTNAAPLARYFPVRAYVSVSDARQISNFADAVVDLLECLGFEISQEYEPVTGSWFKKWIFKSKDVLTSEEVKLRVEKLERAIDLKHLNAPQSEIDQKQAIAVSDLLNSLENIPDAALQVGSILLVKYTVNGKATVQVKTLSQTELLYIEKNQDVLKLPSTTFERLAKISKGNGENPPVNDDEAFKISKELEIGRAESGAQSRPKKLPYVRTPPSGN